MINVNVKTDLRKLQRNLVEFRTKVVERATSSAINKTSLSVRAAAIKEIRTKLKKVKAATIRKRIFINRSTVKTLRATLKNNAQNVPSKAFKIPRSDALWIRYGKRHRNIKSQSGKSIGQIISSGYQIGKLTNIQINQALASNKLQQLMTQVTKKRFPIILEREFRYYSSRV